ncbi:VCBS repeat-containing protein, partial [bacterium]|nr:VCBS repeat-containing protein [bacterium]
MISAPIFRVSFIGVCLMTILCGAQAADVWLDAGYNAPGTPFVAQLHVSDVSDLYGLAFEVLYDTGAVSVPDADANGANGVSAKIVEGDLLNQNGTAQALGAARLPQGQAGRIVAGYSRTGQAAGVDAPDDIFVVGLTVQTTGVTPGTMSLAGVYLEDAAGDPIPLTVLPTVANRNLGTVAVDVTPDAASWTFLDGDGVEHNGTGDQTVTDVHTGEIVLTWDELDPFETPTPNPVTQTLVRDGTVTFSGDYGVGPGFGTVIVTPNAGRAPWVFYDSGGQAHSGTGIATVTDVPSGNIFMVWHYLDGFEQPAPSQEQQVLAPNDTVTFTATYTPYFGFVKVNVTPDTARWTLKDKTGQEQGGQGDQSVVMHAGAVTIHWGLADDHVPPYLVEETRALPRGGQITFEAVYAASSTAQWLAGFGYNDGWRAARHIRTFADVTGDGMADVVGIGDNGVLVARSTGSSFGAASVWTLGFGSKAGWDKERHPRVLADVNGDGRADVVGFGDQGVTVAPSIGTQFAAPALWTKGFGFEAGWQADRHPRFVQDVSGDGMADIVGFGDQGVTVAVSSGYDFQAPALWVQGFGYNDFWMMDRHPRMIADVNGDGRGDVAGFADKG